MKHSSLALPGMRSSYWVPPWLLKSIRATALCSASLACQFVLRQEQYAPGLAFFTVCANPSCSELSLLTAASESRVLGLALCSPVMKSQHSPVVCTLKTTLTASRQEDDDTCRFKVVCDQCSGGCDKLGASVDKDDTTPVCAKVPTGVNASGTGATVESLSLEAGYYRVSNTSRKILECCRAEACKGGSNASNYCEAGYRGPCETPVFDPSSPRRAARSSYFRRMRLCSWNHFRASQ